MRYLFTLALLPLGSPLAAPTPLKVVTDFAGGSARVESIDQQSRTVNVLPYPHKDRGWVCWWYFKLEGVQPGETITLNVGGGVWATPDRAAFSTDGITWTHTPPGERQKDRIVYRIKVEAREAHFAWGPPFTLKHATELVQRCAKDSPHAATFELCKSNGGRSVPGLRVSQAGAKDGERLGIWVQARQHAWEAGSSWVCAGFVEWLLSNDPEAEALRKKAAITIIPIMDVDNVEVGAGGKNQKPHDHNRDWSEKPVWAEVLAATKEIAALNKEGRFDLFVDLHNPGAGDRQPFFFVPAPELQSPLARQNQDHFLGAARAVMTGPLKLNPKARESGANYDPAWEKISTNWVTKNSREHVVAVCLETSWNTPQSTLVNYKQVGKELGLAVERYCREGRRNGKP
jgi:hypothetical protein